MSFWKSKPDFKALIEETGLRDGDYLFVRSIQQVVNEEDGKLEELKEVYDSGK